jgi:hypothetical protein
MIQFFMHMAWEEEEYKEKRKKKKRGIELD